ncbi:MAG TPA: neutral/alkaline non-lysosomal ceramidase N-terminal domain-containing protein [Limnochordia bacterium]
MSAPPLLAATARADITPPVGIAHANWGAAVHQRAEAVDLPLWATALVLAQGELRVAIVDLDLLHLPTPLAKRIRGRVSVLSGIPESCIRLSCTHTHSGPTVNSQTWVEQGIEMIGPYVEALVDKVAGIVWQAAAALLPARVGAARGECGVNLNRRLRLADGRIVVGRNPDGFVDREVAVVRIDTDAGRPIAHLVNYACHPTIMAHRNRRITPDYPGVVKRVVESALGGHCLFLQGAAGNQASIEDLTSDPESYRRVGSILGHEAAKLAWSIRTPPERWEFDTVLESGAPLGLFRRLPAPRPDQSLAALERPVSVPTRQLPPLDVLEAAFAQRREELARLRAGGGDEEAVRQATMRAKRAFHQLRLGQSTGGRESVEIPVQAIRIGEIALLAAPIEPFAEIGVAIKRRSPFPYTLVSGYSNGMMGYLPTAAAHAEGGYEIDASPFGPGAEEAWTEGCLHLLHTLERMPGGSAA